MRSMKDPVCEMEVDEDIAEKTVYNDKTYYFCCSGCMNIFQKSPERYIT